MLNCLYLKRSISLQVRAVKIVYDKIAYNVVNDRLLWSDSFLINSMRVRNYNASNCPFKFPLLIIHSTINPSYFYDYTSHVLKTPTHRFVYIL